MKSVIKPGFEHVLEYTVTDKKTVPALYPESPYFASMPSVFATGFMVGFMEWACMDALAPYLEEGECTLGTHINVSHCAATPVGMKVRAHVKCTEVDGQRTKWAIKAYDEKDLIGEGTHDRFTVNQEKFTRKLESKKNS